MNNSVLEVGTRSGRRACHVAAPGARTAGEEASMARPCAAGDLSRAQRSRGPADFRIPSGRAAHRIGLRRVGGAGAGTAVRRGSRPRVCDFRFGCRRGGATGSRSPPRTGDLSNVPRSAPGHPVTTHAVAASGDAPRGPASAGEDERSAVATTGAVHVLGTLDRPWCPLAIPKRGAPGRESMTIGGGVDPAPGPATATLHLPSLGPGRSCQTMPPVRASPGCRPAPSRRPAGRWCPA